MKKVLLSSNLFYPNVGGIENSLVNLAREYSRLNYQVDLLCSDMNNVSTEKLKLVEKLDDNITIYRYSCHHHIVPKFIYMYFSAAKLFKQFLSIDYELVLSRYHFTTIIAKAVGFKNVNYLLPSVVKTQRLSERAEVSEYLYKRLKRKINNYYHHLLQKLAVKWADLLIVFSKNMVNQLHEVFSIPTNRINVIKPGVDLTKFSAISQLDKDNLKSELNLPLRKTILLGLGRFVGSKSFDIAIKTIVDLNDNFHLVLVGDGPELIVYKQLITNLALESKVTLFGRTCTPELYFKCADLFLMTSHYEALGQTIIEAQACGLPIVAFLPSKIVQTATFEVTQKNSRELAKNTSPKSLALAILKADEKIKSFHFQPEQISDFARNSFSWETLSVELLKLNRECNK